jgi:Fe-S cluster assembly protein SufD
MLRDKFISSFLAFENKGIIDVDADFHQKRSQAMQHFEKVGFPTKKIEEWHYTSLKDTLKRDYRLFPLNSQNEINAQEAQKHLLKGVESYKIVFVDGVYQPYLSETTHDGMDICLLSSAIEKTKYKVVLDYYFDTLVQKKLDGITALNTAFASEGAFIHIPKNTIVHKPIQILYLTTKNEHDVLLQPRNLIIVDENAQVKIVEKHQSLSNHPVLNNTVTEIFTGKRAVVDYYKIQNDKLNASLIDTTLVQQKDQSNVSINTYSFGGDLTRNNIHIFHEGENINTMLNGISMLHGTQHVDHQTNIYHQKPNCESHELYKGIYDDQSTGVFNGKVIVDKIAQKTDAFQQNDNILLTDDATINAKPQLEIFADDVKCSHGCTIGQLDANALFYMKQRGIPHKEAQALLLYAFTDEVVSRIKISALKSWITHLISDKLGVTLDLEV